MMSEEWKSNVAEIIIKGKEFNIKCKWRILCVWYNQPIVMPCEATIGIWGNGFLSAEIYFSPPKTETG